MQQNPSTSVILINYFKSGHRATAVPFSAPPKQPVNPPLQMYCNHIDIVVPFLILGIYLTSQSYITYLNET